ncbi:hypothetical protein lerEdw1_005746 [Lerista edwardsae]|nr:hypothetical protein lerEdw1_005746 [Lerista edwardsae]
MSPFLSTAQCCIAIFVGLLFTRFWLVSVLYAVWWTLDWETPSRGGRKIHWIRNGVVWRYMKDYFPITTQTPNSGESLKKITLCDKRRTCLVKTAELDPAKNYIFGFHPHGVLVAGAFLNFCTEATGFSALFPGLTPYLMMLTLWFRVPFFRDYLLSGGLVTSEKESASYILRKPGGGNVLTIVVGGAQEALDARPGAFKLLLANRKGFVRLAIEHGAPLVPVFSFGENELFDQVENPKGSWLRWTQERLQRIMKISLPLFHARGIFQYSFGLLPYRRPIYTVVGKPIEVEKKFHPSEDEVDSLHKKYMEELCALFEAHKLKYNVPADTHLSFI